MKLTIRRGRRHPILLLRDARGRFAKVRRPLPPKKRTRRRRPTKMLPAVLQLVLF